MEKRFLTDSHWQQTTNCSDAQLKDNMLYKTSWLLIWIKDSERSHAWLLQDFFSDCLPSQSRITLWLAPKIVLTLSSVSPVASFPTQPWRCFHLLSLVYFQSISKICFLFLLLCALVQFVAISPYFLSSQAI